MFTKKPSNKEGWRMSAQQTADYFAKSPEMAIGRKKLLMWARLGIVRCHAGARGLVFDLDEVAQDIRAQREREKDYRLKKMRGGAGVY
jgi:hypothetical protein